MLLLLLLVLLLLVLFIDISIRKNLHCTYSNSGNTCYHSKSHIRLIIIVIKVTTRILWIMPSGCQFCMPYFLLSCFALCLSSFASFP